MLGEDHFATSWVWAGYILDSGYFQFQPFLIGYFGEIAFFVFLAVQDSSIGDLVTD